MALEWKKILLEGDGGSEVPLSNRSPAGDVTITAGYSAVVVGDYEIASGFILDLLTNSVLEIS